MKENDSNNSDEKRACPLCGLTSDWFVNDEGVAICGCGAAIDDRR